MEEQCIHPRIFNPIRDLQRLDGDDLRRHVLYIDGAIDVNLQSVQYLVDFLNGETHDVTELVFEGFMLVQQPDGGLNVLQDFFANSRILLTKVVLKSCFFGSEEDTLRLLVALRTNRSVTDLTLHAIGNLDGAELGACLSALLQNNPTLQRLECSYFLGGMLNAATLRALQPGLRANRHLKKLCLYFCHLGDEGFRLLMDALVGNEVIEVLDVSYNLITSNVLHDITRLLKLTQMKVINVRCNHVRIFTNNYAAQNFTRDLHQNTSLESLPGFDFALFPAIVNILARNTSIRHAKELLQLQPRTCMPIGSKSGIWYMAFGKLAEVTGNDNGVAHTGASAIFHILRARPAILEKQLRRPAAAAAAPATAASSTTTQHGRSTQPPRQHDSPTNGGSGTNNKTSSEAGAFGARKRQRLM